MTIKPEWRFVKANIHPFEKIIEIKLAFRIALVSYHLWTELLVHKISGDLAGIFVWTSERKNVSWVALLNAIFKEYGVV